MAKITTCDACGLQLKNRSMSGITLSLYPNTGRDNIYNQFDVCTDCYREIVHNLPRALEILTKNYDS